jgi:hypothetical protein
MARVMLRNMQMQHVYFCILGQVPSLTHLRRSSTARDAGVPSKSSELQLRRAMPSPESAKGPVHIIMGARINVFGGYGSV